MRTILALATVTLLVVMTCSRSQAQDWQQNDQIFNPSGIPSLAFSQPRFADLDADDDFDLILGSIAGPPLYYQNIGTANDPAFQAGAPIFAVVDPLDAEVGVCSDLDDDGDLDFICGGYTGLQLYDNTGSAAAPEFQIIAGFFGDLDVGTIPVPTLADLDGDGDYDLLVGLSEDGLLKYYPNSGTPNAAEFMETLAEPWYDVGLYAYPWFSDLDGDFDFDLLAGRDLPGFYFYRNIGDTTSWLWQADHGVFAGLAGTTYWNSPCLVDLTGDGLLDLVYGTASGPLEYFVNTGNATTPVWTIDTSLFGGVLDVGAASSPVFYDFDADNDLDLVSGSQLGDIKYFENVGSLNAPAWQADHDLFASIDHSIYSAITLGDVDADGLPDAIAGDLSGNLFLHHNTGSGFVYDSGVFLGVDLGNWSVPRLVDMDADLDLDIVAGNEAGLLIYFENQGQIDAPDWVEITGFFGGIDVGSNCVPALGDFDKDGDQDLIAGSLFSEVRYFANVAGTWIEDPAVLDGVTVGQNAAPALADLDDDGDLDLTVGNYAGTFNYFENTSPPTYLPAQRETPKIGYALSVCPNPFNPVTTIRYRVTEPSNITLTIYDVGGRSVRALCAAPQPAGQHSVRWDGTDDSGQSLGSGIYFCRLLVKEDYQTIKMVYLK